MSRKEEIRVGLIGLDTSHGVAFTQLLNDPSAPGHLPGARVVAAVKTCSPDMEASVSRVDAFAATLQEKFGVRLLGSIAELCREVDAVMILSLDGRAHLAQAREVLAAKKRIFIDKPLAASVHDALEIVRLSRAAAVPVFSASSYRFYPSLLKVKTVDVGAIRSAISYGPAYLEPHHPDLLFYGIHPAEALFAVLGPGCESVVRSHTADSDVVTGQWSDGRLGVLHGLRTQAIPHRVLVFGATGFVEQQPTDRQFNRFGALDAVGTGPDADSYASLLREIVSFFRSGVAPLHIEETVEVIAFLEAADESKRRGGVPVRLSEVIGLLSHAANKSPGDHDRLS